MASHITVALLSVCFASLWICATLESTQLCNNPSPCVFHCGGLMLDLTPLSGVGDEPMFKDQWDSQGQAKFSFSPCSSFSEGSGCVNTSVCQIPDALDPSNTVDVGSSASETLRSNPDTRSAFLTYFHTQGGVRRTTTVTLQCVAGNSSLTSGSPGALNVTGEVKADSGNYSMTLTSPYACFEAVSDATTEPSVVSTTSEANMTSEHTPTTEPPSNTTSHENGTTPEHTVTTEPPSNTTSNGNVTTPEGTMTSESMTTSNVTVVTQTSPGGTSAGAGTSESSTGTSTLPSTTPAGGHASTLRSSVFVMILVAIVMSVLRC